MCLRLVTGAAVACALSVSQPASASSSDWIETEGGRVRLVTAGMPDAQGNLRGALEIALKPGWKTYWRDPGEAGIAPSLEIGESINVSAATIRFPPPKRFDDGYSVWAGYDRPVSLPVTFKVDKPDRFAAIDAAVFLGVCETVCIPVQGSLSLDPGADPDSQQDRAAVDAAFAALPSPARPGFQVSAARLDGDRLLAEVALPDGTSELELFLVGTQGMTFGTPVRADEDGPLVFEAPLVGQNGQGGAREQIHYVLTTGQGSVSGSIFLP